MASTASRVVEVIQLVPGSELAVIGYSYQRLLYRPSDGGAGAQRNVLGARRIIRFIRALPPLRESHPVKRLHDE